VKASAIFSSRGEKFGGNPTVIWAISAQLWVRV
jgi:hypothetical protein